MHLEDFEFYNTAETICLWTSSIISYSIFRGTVHDFTVLRFSSYLPRTVLTSAVYTDLRGPFEKFVDSPY